MSYTISNLKQDLSAVLHGTTNNKIVNINGLIDRAARDVLLDVNPQETKRIVPITNSVFNSVYDYPVPTDLKQNQVIDIRPQVNRLASEVFLQQYNQAFDLSKSWSIQDSFTVQFNTAIKSVRINAPFLPAPTVANACDSITGNGTWAVGSSASNLAIDNVNFVTNGASLSFDLAALGSTGYLENDDMTSVDMSSLLNQGTFFLYTYLPTASDFTNVILRWGSSSSDYYQVTATATQQNTTFQDGWNLLAFNWLGATVVGSPDESAINYLRVTWTYDGTVQTSVRLSQITAALGTILEMEYYSRYLFRDGTTGAFQETVTADSNIINLENNNLLTYKVAELAAQQTQGANAIQYDGKYFTEKYKEILTKYKLLYRSETQKPTTTYYAIRKPRTGASPRTRYGY